jgi:hypothetical protein
VTAPTDKFVGFHEPFRFNRLQPESGSLKQILILIGEFLHVIEFKRQPFQLISLPNKDNIYICYLI